MADNIANLHLVFTTCGVSIDATRTLIINNEFLTSITDFCFLDGVDDDVTVISLHMARRVANNGCMILGGIQIKKIQALVWWVRDRQELGQPIDAALWTAAVMTNDGIAKRIKKDQPKADKKAGDFKAFNPDHFETHEDAFRNYLSQITSVTKKLCFLYIVCLAMALSKFTVDFEERMFQMPLIRQGYNLDSCMIYAKLKAFLIGNS